MTWNTLVAGALSIFLAGVAVGGGAGQQLISFPFKETARSLAPDARLPEGNPQAGLVAARVVGVTDGDTMTVRSSDGVQWTIRLAEIDAPETGQPWGARATEALAKLTFAQNVQVRTAGKDRYGRMLGRVYSSGTDVNAEMIRAGHAWAYRDYLRG